MFPQQRSVMTRADFETELDSILTNGIPGTINGPDSTMLKKASTDARRIMALVDKYLLGR